MIETEGLDAMRMPRVAEVAGCARSLVYGDFPRREDRFDAQGWRGPTPSPRERRPRW